jgi:hypothetical protein
MLHRTTRTVGLGAALALGVSACNPDDLTNINVNPNAPLEAPPSATFTSAARVAAARWLGTTYDLRQTSLTAQHLAEVQYPETDQYQRLAAGFTSLTFGASYYSELADLQGVVRTAEAADDPGLYAPALVLRTWVFGYLTDSWGDVPYKDAFKGDSSAAGLAPAYDPQQEIYADFFVTLDRATKALAAAPASSVNLGQADPVYGGNFTRWERFSNSLRARHAMRLANVDPATARTQFVAAVNAPGGLFASNADNALFKWPGDGVYDNPWAVNFQTRNDHRISTRLMGELLGEAASTADDDPRVAVYARPTSASATNPALPRYVGLENALEHSQAVPQLNTTSRPGIVLYTAGGGQSFPSFMMTYAEVSFLKAEARERGWITTGTAAQYYEDGIRASMDQWGVTSAAAITAFLAQPRIAYKGGVEGLKQIARQKWVALFTDGGQAWAEWRRTCQPSTVRPGPAAILNEVPRRLQYSTTELSVNAANVAAAVARQGPDEFLTRIYWDKNPTAAPTYEPGCGVRQ